VVLEFKRQPDHNKMAMESIRLMQCNNRRFEPFRKISTCLELRVSLQDLRGCFLESWRKYKLAFSNGLEIMLASYAKLHQNSLHHQN